MQPSGTRLGRPTIAIDMVQVGDKDFQSVMLATNIAGRGELSYALNRFGLGDWNGAVRQATGMRTQHHVLLHHANLRWMLFREAGLRPWLPAVTLGLHGKYNASLTDMNRDMQGTCDRVGVNHQAGFELSLIASKTVTAPLCRRPLILSLGVRNSDAIHIGLMGFAGRRRWTAEGSLILLLTPRLLLATEYRQKSDLTHRSCGDLLKRENDWWNVCIAYVLSDQLAIAGGIADFGNVLNHHESMVLACQIKYEFRP